MRGALSSLLLLVSLLGRWFSRPAAAVFTTSLRNQNKGNWLNRSLSDRIQVLGMNRTPISSMKDGTPPADASPNPKRASQGIGRRRALGRRLKKRAIHAAFAEFEIPEERPSKRYRQMPRYQWRFWLLNSSELDEVDSVDVPLAGSNMQTMRFPIERHDFCEILAQSLPLGDEIFPVKPDREEAGLCQICFYGITINKTTSEQHDKCIARKTPWGDEIQLQFRERELPSPAGGGAA
ncbi:unnamed protein product [Linum trigynum]|uniref:Uncharacterized protein n=1 Tax=Linum trigynum TaxID=586398 RepID=A0AAV2FW84_9ROSI